MKIKVLFYFSVFVFLLLNGEISAKEMVKAKRGTLTTFAIIVDADSWKECKDEILSYKNILESEGLGTYIISSNWSSPEEVKSEIFKLRRSSSPLEGIVLIGDIPIVQVQQGQHMTTAFKMHESNFPIERSSVPTDRFYDDFDLKFDYLKKDSINPLIYYYTISSLGSQTIDPDIYCSRIKIPKRMYADLGEQKKYDLLSSYLKKVVATHKESNEMDNFLFFAGHGYNSDCLTAWSQQSLLFKEYFPKAFEKASTHKFMNFRQSPYMKYELFSQMQREDVDIFMFYEHGSFNKQYINSSYNSGTLQDHIEQLLISLRYECRTAIGRGQNYDDFLEKMPSHYGFSKKLFTKEILDSTRVSDSTAFAGLDISLDDLSKLKTSAKFTLLNACFNGSFHREDGYVAAYHLFNDGKTVVTQANTVNALQDKWADELIGYLDLGVRIGLWQKDVTTLESHLIGDPTFRFVNSNLLEKSNEYNKALVLSLNDEDYWKNLYKSKRSIERAMAVKQLAKLNKSDKFAEELYNIFINDRSAIVRLQALNEIADYSGEYRQKLINLALTNSYEQIRRFASHIAGDMGDSLFIGKMVDNVLMHPEAVRTVYASQTNLSLFDLELVKEVYMTALDNSNLFNKKKLREYIIKDIEKHAKKDEKEISLIFNKNADIKKREMVIRTLRNYPMHSQIESFIEFVFDDEQDQKLRVIMTEALGWCDKSYKSHLIKDAFKNYLTKKGLLDPISDKKIVNLSRLDKEILKTYKRLSYI